MRTILAGAAAIALAATGAHADPGKGNDNGNSGGKGKSQAVEMKQDRGGAKERSQNASQGRPDKGPSMREERKSADRDESRPNERRLESRGNDKGERGQERRFDDRGRDAVRIEGRSGDGRDFIERADFRDGRDGRGFFDRDRSPVLITGCPPGLAKKNNGCTPPGQLKDDYERSLFGYSYRPSLFGLGGYGDGRYFYNDGYLLRLGNGGLINGYIPLLGGALAIGNPWPSSYSYYQVPDYYVDYYDLGGRRSYRYADDIIYRVDPEDAAIMSVAALLTGDDIRVGQPMPSGYDVYNVPYAYRDRYYDTPDAYYRYSDGYVYRVDPETQLVAAVIDLLV